MDKILSGSETNIKYCLESAKQGLNILMDEIREIESNELSPKLFLVFTQKININGQVYTCPLLALTDLSQIDPFLEALLPSTTDDQFKKIKKTFGMDWDSLLKLTIDIEDNHYEGFLAMKQGDEIVYHQDYACMQLSPNDIQLYIDLFRSMIKILSNEVIIDI